MTTPNGPNGPSGAGGTDADADRLARLERRVRELEDTAEIQRLIATYGPLVDSGDAEAVAALWEPDGVYDVDTGVLTGHDEIAAMVRSRPHQRLIATGCAHVVGPAHVTVHGDEATATCYSQLLLHDAPDAPDDAAAPETGTGTGTGTGASTRPGGFRVLRVTANHWHLRRGPHGWRVHRRTNRLLDGRPTAPTLLAADVTPPTTPAS
ncbi:nuclear transport factor 2 family protein [Saccharomonospora iraqiensis]|uniref:nuclear transport factor 2 family protein n=1 Tax=Saccharomonospora iraqiensis TaxID=52698 RepID=UPI000404A8BE|nr:nuclear transport factor 2 family protein [Saccharomonospora iraqiensis]